MEKGWNINEENSLILIRVFSLFDKRNIKISVLM